jgi:hypothetical protein
MGVLRGIQGYEAQRRPRRYIWPLARTQHRPQQPNGRFRLAGHSDTTTTETVYRHQIRPVVQGGAEVMDAVFPRDSPDA